MKLRAKRILLAVTATVMMSALPSGWAGETMAQHLISTKAGFVNRAEGRVEIERYGSVDEERGRASTGTQMRNGDRLSTQADGLAEVLLNPGTYLRLSPRTQIRAVETNLSSIHFELVRGSIILEVGEVGKTSPIQLDTPQGPLTIQRDGLHRIEANGGVTRIAVRQGDLWIGQPADVFASREPGSDAANSPPCNREPPRLCSPGSTRTRRTTSIVGASHARRPWSRPTISRCVIRKVSAVSPLVGSSTR